MSEDDIRTKVVYPWLLACGFSPAAVSVEFSFDIRLGRSIYRVGEPKVNQASGAGVKNVVARPRADVLVRHGETALFIIEVKAPDEAVDDDARDQGISYARLLPRIAPFVLVTNGTVSKLYDSITRAEITGTTLTPDHTNFKAGYVLSGDELLLRAEALESFVSLSPENLLAFCERQLHYRLRRLRDDDPASGKKYIPSLYVDRRFARERLGSLLQGGSSRVVAVTGKPQVGKTNFLCRFAEELLRAGQPVLFYPAVSLNGSLLSEMADDFGWLLGDQNPVVVLVAKLGRVLAKPGQYLTVVIDGWNEADIDLARTIDRECERVYSNQSAIRLVVSFTNTSARRLLTSAGGTSFFAEETGIGSRGCALLESDPSEANRQRGWSSVAVEAYDLAEQAEAYRVLARHFGVVVPASHAMVTDPYLLGVAMRHFAGRELPEEMDEPGLVGAWLEARIGRYTLDSFDVHAAATELAREMLSSGSPLPERLAKRCWGIAPVDPMPATLPDMAVLAFLGGSSGRYVDFYNNRDRDFVTAFWACRWHERLSDRDALWPEFAAAAESRSGVDALTWFFKHLPHLTQLLEPNGSLPTIPDSGVRRMFLSTVAQVAVRRHELSESGRTDVGSEAIKNFMRAEEIWAEQCANLAGTDPDAKCRIEAVRLLVSIVDDRDDLLNALPSNESLAEVVRGLLETHEVDPLTGGGLGGKVLEVMRHLHMDLSIGHHDTPSSVTVILDRESVDTTPEIREAAFAVLGDLRPRYFVKEVVGRLPGRLVPREYYYGVSNAIQQIEDSYYGDPMCPSFMSHLEQDRESEEVIGCWQEEYEMASALSRFTNIPQSRAQLNGLLDELRDLLPLDYREQTPALPTHDAPGQQLLFEDDDHRVDNSDRGEE